MIKKKIIRKVCEESFSKCLDCLEYDFCVRIKQRLEYFRQKAFDDEKIKIETIVNSESL